MDSETIEEDSRISIEEYNREIDDAMARIDSGKFTAQEDVEKEMDQW